MPPPIGCGARSKKPMSSVSGLDLLTRIVWHRGKAKINRILGHHETSRIPTVQSFRPLPYELVEAIIAYLIDDIQALKACSLICYSWYITVVPHLHSTFVFGGVDRAGLKLLSVWHALGLLPLVKDLQILQSSTQPRRLRPQSFSRRNSRCFSAFTNVQNLKVQHLDIQDYIPRLERHFGHFSPTLRSITLDAPRCTPRQLSHFFSLFPNLDDIEIRSFTHIKTGIPDDALVPFYTPKFHGRLTLSSFTAVDTWKDLAASCGLRFRSIYFYPVSKCAPVLLAACAETLETLRIEPDDEFEWFQESLANDFNLSQLEVLRSLQIKPPALFLRNLAYKKPTADFLTTIESIFYTITSPVFSELVIVIQSGDVYHFPWRMYDTLRRMHDVRPFKLLFLLLGSEKSSEEVARRTWEGAVDTATAKGLLRFLESPPSIRFIQRDRS